MGRVLLLLTTAQLADLLLTTLAVARYGPSVEVNPLVAGVLSLGVGGIVAWKAALLAVIVASAALNPRWERLLIAGALLSGVVGAASGLVVLV
jgi:Domain of unknown function (DUF5658)